MKVTIFARYRRYMRYFNLGESMQYFGYCLLFDGKTDALHLSLPSKGTPQIWKPIAGVKHERSHATFCEIVNPLVMNLRLFIEGVASCTKVPNKSQKNIAPFPSVKTTYKMIAHDNLNTSFLQTEKQLVPGEFAMFSNMAPDLDRNSWVTEEEDSYNRMAGITAANPRYAHKFVDDKRNLQIYSRAVLDLVGNILTEPQENLIFSAIRIDDSVNRHKRALTSISSILISKPGTLIGVNIRGFKDDPASPIYFTLMWVGFNIYLTWTDDVDALAASVEVANSMPSSQANYSRVITGLLPSIAVKDTTIALPFGMLRTKILERWTNTRNNRSLAMTDMLQIIQRRIYKSIAKHARQSENFSDYTKAQQMMED